MNKSQHWQAIIKQWKDSGLTQKQFCADREIKIATLHYWIKKLRTEKVVDSEPGFLALCSVPVPDSDRIELRFGGAVIYLTITQLPDALLALQHKGLLHAPA
jgi:hypothetical protein